MEVRKVDPRQVAAYRRQRKAIVISSGKKKSVDEKPQLVDEKQQSVAEVPRAADECVDLFSSLR